MLRNHANEVGRFACVVILNEVLSLNAQELTTLNALAVLVGASSMKS